MKARLSPEKLGKARELLNKYSNKRKLRLRELQSLIGYLNFCCNVVPPGRCFLRRLIDKTKNVSNPSHRVTVNNERRRDIQAWHRTFHRTFQWEEFSCCETLEDHAKSLHLHTDAAGSLGFGAMFENNWFNGSWPAQIAHLPITFKELFHIVLALEI